MEDRRTGNQRRHFYRFLSIKRRKIGRRLDDLEFAVLLRIVGLTILSLFVCIAVIAMFL